MNDVLRAFLIYAFLWFIIRISGKRTLSENSTFDLVLLLIIAESVQQGLVGHSYSLTTAGILIVTLIGIDILLSYGKSRWDFFEKVTDSVPVVIAKDGKVIQERMKKTRIRKEDIMVALRSKHGIGEIDAIKYAILESDGSISIVLKRYTGYGLD